MTVAGDRVGPFELLSRIGQGPALQQMAVDVEADGTFQPGVPRPLFFIPVLAHGDVSADGKRFPNITP